MNKQLSKTSNPRFKQGRFVPHHPEKYLGNINDIFLRSSWERVFANWCDNNPAIVAWTSEQVVVPYVSPVDGNVHRYYIDFGFCVKTKNGPKKYLVEIKPYNQTIQPVITQRKRPQTILEEARTYAVNSAKWEASKQYAKKIGCEFVVLTEYELGIAHGNKPR